jgi:hypothetical protein
MSSDEESASAETKTEDFASDAGMTRKPYFLFSKVYLYSRAHYRSNALGHTLRRSHY